MDEIITILISTLAGLFAGLITAYITTHLKIKQEKKKWDREFAMKYLEAKSSGKNYAQEIASQYAVGYILVIEMQEGIAMSSPRKIFIPHNCRLIAGRGEDNDIVIDDQAVSRKHIMFTAEEKEVWVEDLATTMGIYLITQGKKQKITGAHKLQVGDLVEIGNHCMEFRHLEKNYS